MAGVLLPAAIAAKGFVDSSIPLHVTAIAAANTYGVVVAPVAIALGNAVTQVGLIQTALIPSGAIAPPAKLGINITGAILAQLATVQTAITTAIGVATLLPEPAATTTFTTATGVVTTTLPVISSAITAGLITPQSA